MLYSLFLKSKYIYDAIWVRYGSSYLLTWICRTEAGEILQVQDQPDLISESLQARLVIKQDSLSTTTTIIVFVCFKEALVERNREEERAGEREESATDRGQRGVSQTNKGVYRCLGTL